MAEMVAVLVASWVVFVQVCSSQVIYRPGDSGPAVRAEISDPQAIAIDSAGTLYIAGNELGIRRVDLRSGIITTLQTNRKLEGISSLAVDTSGNIMATEDGNRVIKIDPDDGSVTTIAGGGRLDFSGDGGQAKDAKLGRPCDHCNKPARWETDYNVFGEHATQSANPKQVCDAHSRTFADQWLHAQLPPESR